MFETLLWKILKWKRPSIVLLFSEMFRKNEIVTIKKKEKQFGIVADHLQNWIDPMLFLTKKYPLTNWGILGFTFGELFSDLNLVVFSIAGGSYFNAARTMRSIYESIVNAAYVAEKYYWFPALIYEAMEEHISEEIFHDHIKCKLKKEFNLSNEEIKKITGFKYGMVNELKFLTSDEKDCVFKLYSQLSQLVHPSPLKLKKYTEDAFRGTTFFYDKNFFTQCAKLMDDLIDLVLAVLIFSFPEIKSDIKNQKFVYQSMSRLTITSRLLDQSV